MRCWEGIPQQASKLADVGDKKMFFDKGDAEPIRP